MQIKMKGILEHIYFSSPICIQNILISIYGFKLFNQRYGGKSKQYDKYLNETQLYSKDDLFSLQEDLFRRTIEHAFATVPFYMELNAKTGLCANDINGLADICKLPVIEKELIRSQPEKFCSNDYIYDKSCFWLNTSGSTGKPLRILCDKESRRLHYSFWTRLRTNNQIGKRAKRATFFGRIICSPQQDRPPFWRYDFVGKNKLFSSYHMSDNNLRSYYDELVRYKPIEIIGYPSSIYLLSKYINSNGLNELSPKAVITTAETLLAYQRDEISNAFKSSTIIDQYGCTEMTLFVSQCHTGAYHINPEHGVIEIQNLSGGNTGEVICTGFVNRAMPLIRYRLGDVLTICKDACSCGTNFPVIEKIVGRTDDLLVSPDGRQLGRMDPIFKGMHGIFETQIIQKEYDALEIKIVVDDSFCDDNKIELIREIRKRTGESMMVDINIVSSIPKNSNGKFKSVISLIS